MKFGCNEGSHGGCGGAGQGSDGDGVGGNHGSQRFKGLCSEEQNWRIIHFLYFHSCSTHGNLIGQDEKYSQTAYKWAREDRKIFAAASH